MLTEFVGTKNSKLRINVFKTAATVCILVSFEIDFPKYLKSNFKNIPFSSCSVSIFTDFPTAEILKIPCTFVPFKNIKSKHFFIKNGIPLSSYYFLNLIIY